MGGEASAGPGKTSTQGGQPPRDPKRVLECRTLFGKFCRRWDPAASWMGFWKIFKTTKRGVGAARFRAVSEARRPGWSVQMVRRHGDSRPCATGPVQSPQPRWLSRRPMDSPDITPSARRSTRSVQRGDGAAGGGGQSIEPRPRVMASPRAAPRCNVQGLGEMKPEHSGRHHDPGRDAAQVTMETPSGRRDVQVLMGMPSSRAASSREERSSTGQTKVTSQAHVHDPERRRPSDRREMAVVSRRNVRHRRAGGRTSAGMKPVHRRGLSPCPVGITFNRPTRGGARGGEVIGK